MHSYGNCFQKNIYNILNGFNINIKDLKNKDIMAICNEGNICDYQDTLDILKSIVSKYVVPLDDIYLIHYTINNDESYLLDKSDSKIFYLDEYTVKGRDWVYKCEIDDYIFIIEKKIKFYYNI